MKKSSPSYSPTVTATAAAMASNSMITGSGGGNTGTITKLRTSSNTNSVATRNTQGSGPGYSKFNANLNGNTSIQNSLNSNNHSVSLSLNQKLSNSNSTLIPGPGNTSINTNGTSVTRAPRNYNGMVQRDSDNHLNQLQLEKVMNSVARANGVNAVTSSTRHSGGQGSQQTATTQQNINSNVSNGLAPGQKKSYLSNHQNSNASTSNTTSQSSIKMAYGTPFRPPQRTVESASKNPLASTSKNNFVANPLPFQDRNGNTTSSNINSTGSGLKEVHFSSNHSETYSINKVQRVTPVRSNSRDNLNIRGSKNRSSGHTNNNYNNNSISLSVSGTTNNSINASAVPGKTVTSNQNLVTSVTNPGHSSSSNTVTDANGAQQNNQNHNVNDLSNLIDVSAVISCGPEAGVDNSLNLDSISGDIIDNIPSLLPEESQIISAVAAAAAAGNGTANQNIKSRINSNTVNQKSVPRLSLNSGSASMSQSIENSISVSELESRKGMKQGNCNSKTGSSQALAQSSHGKSSTVTVSGQPRPRSRSGSGIHSNTGNLSNKSKLLSRSGSSDNVGVRAKVRLLTATPSSPAQYQRSSSTSKLLNKGSTQQATSMSSTTGTGSITRDRSISGTTAQLLRASAAAAAVAQTQNETKTQSVSSSINFSESVKNLLEAGINRSNSINRNSNNQSNNLNQNVNSSALSEIQRMSLERSEASFSRLSNSVLSMNNVTNSMNLNQSAPSSNNKSKSAKFDQQNSTLSSKQIHGSDLLKSRTKGINGRAPPGGFQSIINQNTSSKSQNRSKTPDPTSAYGGGATGSTITKNLIMQSSQSKFKSYNTTPNGKQQLKSSLHGQQQNLNNSILGQNYNRFKTPIASSPSGVTGSGPRGLQKRGLNRSASTSFAGNLSHLNKGRIATMTQNPNQRNKTSNSYSIGLNSNSNSVNNIGTPEDSENIPMLFYSENHAKRLNLSQSTLNNSISNNNLNLKQHGLNHNRHSGKNIQNSNSKSKFALPSRSKSSNNSKSSSTTTATGYSGTNSMSQARQSSKSSTNSNNYAQSVTNSNSNSRTSTKSQSHLTGPTESNNQMNHKTAAALTAKLLVHQDLFDEVIHRSNSGNSIQIDGHFFANTTELLRQIKAVYDEELEYTNRSNPSLIKTNKQKSSLVNSNANSNLKSSKTRANYNHGANNSTSLCQSMLIQEQQSQKELEQQVEQATMRNQNAKRELKSVEQEFRIEIDLLKEAQQNFQDTLDKVASVNQSQNLQNQIKSQSESQLNQNINENIDHVSVDDSQQFDKLNDNHNTNQTMQQRLKDTKNLIFGAPLPFSNPKIAAAAAAITNDKDHDSDVSLLKRSDSRDRKGSLSLISNTTSMNTQQQLKQVTTSTHHHARNNINNTLVTESCESMLSMSLQSVTTGLAHHGNVDKKDRPAAAESPLMGSPNLQTSSLDQGGLQQFQLTETPDHENFQNQNSNHNINITLETDNSIRELQNDNIDGYTSKYDIDSESDYTDVTDDDTGLGKTRPSSRFPRKVFQAPVVRPAFVPTLNLNHIHDQEEEDEEECEEEHDGNGDGEQYSNTENDEHDDHDADDDHHTKTQEESSLNFNFDDNVKYDVAYRFHDDPHDDLNATMGVDESMMNLAVAR